MPQQRSFSLLGNMSPGRERFLIQLVHKSFIIQLVRRSYRPFTLIALVDNFPSSVRVQTPLLKFTPTPLLSASDSEIRVQLDSGA